MYMGYKDIKCGTIALLENLYHICFFQSVGKEPWCNDA